MEGSSGFPFRFHFRFHVHLTCRVRRVGQVEMCAEAVLTATASATDWSGRDAGRRSGFALGSSLAERDASSKELRPTRSRTTEPPERAGASCEYCWKKLTNGVCATGEPIGPFLKKSHGSEPMSLVSRLISLTRRANTSWKRLTSCLRKTFYEMARRRIASRLKKIFLYEPWAKISGWFMSHLASHVAHENNAKKIKERKKQGTLSASGKISPLPSVVVFWCRLHLHLNVMAQWARSTQSRDVRARENASFHINQLFHLTDGQHPTRWPRTFHKIILTDHWLAFQRLTGQKSGRSCSRPPVLQICP